MTRTALVLIATTTVLVSCQTVSLQDRTRSQQSSAPVVPSRPDPQIDYVGEGGVYSVVDFGAVGDGATDDTAAFQKALDTAARDNGGLVLIPSGRFRIASHLNIPDHVTLEGVWRGPNRGPEGKGTTLYATEGKGDASGTPFITLNTNSNLRGLTIHYPEQLDQNPPRAYPWTVQGKGANASIIDVLMTNPYQAVDFGSYPSAGHYVRGLNAQALYRGIYVDQSRGIGRLEDIQFMPLWSKSEALRRFTQEKGIAFSFGRTDGHYVSNAFCTGYNIGFYFKDFGHGPGTVHVSQSGVTNGITAVRIEESREPGGISFVNSEFNAGVEVDSDNRGPVKFTSSGFSPVADTQYHAALAGKGHVFFEGCHFSDWDMADTGAACIQANSEGITIVGCDFMTEGKIQISLGPRVRSAIVTSNRLRGGAHIINRSKGDVQIGFNTRRSDSQDPIEIRSVGGRR